MLKHKLGFNQNNDWQYEQKKNTTIFEQSLHRDLHPINAMDIVLKKEALKHKDLKCHLKIGFKAFTFRN